MLTLQVAIYLASGVVALASSPSPTDRFTRIETSSGKSFEISSTPYSEAQQRVLDALSEEQRELFSLKRRRFLESAAKAIAPTQPFLGVCASIKESFFCLAQGRRIKNMFSSEKGKAAAQSILNAIDFELWEHSPLVTELEEFGVMISANLNGGAAFGKKGYYYAVGVGVSAGYNHKTGNSVVEVFTETQKLKKGFVAQVALSGQAMVYGSKTNANRMQVGRFITPPGPVASFDSSEKLALGLNQGIGFPPLDTFYAYETESKRKAFIKINFSRFKKMDPQEVNEFLTHPELLDSTSTPESYCIGQIFSLFKKKK